MVGALGTKLTFFGKAAGAFNKWSMYPVPVGFILTHCSNITVQHVREDMGGERWGSCSPCMYSQEQRGVNVGAQPIFSFLFSSGLQPMGCCCPYLGWLGGSPLLSNSRVKTLSGKRPEDCLPGDFWCFQVDIQYQPWRESSLNFQAFKSLENCWQSMLINGLFKLAASPGAPSYASIWEESPVLILKSVGATRKGGHVLWDTSTESMAMHQECLCKTQFKTLKEEWSYLFCRKRK